MNGEHSWGIDGETGRAVDMKTYGLYESSSVKVCHCYSCAIDTSNLIRCLIDPDLEDRNRGERDGVTDHNSAD